MFYVVLWRTRAARLLPFDASLAAEDAPAELSWRDASLLGPSEGRVGRIKQTSSTVSIAISSARLVIQSITALVQTLSYTCTCKRQLEENASQHTFVAQNHSAASLAMAA